MLDKRETGIIFDMDGVVIDTCKLHEDSWFKTSRIFDLSWDESIDFKEEIFGTSSHDSARMLFKQNFTESAIEEICSQKCGVYEELLKERIDSIIMPGFLDFFNSLVKKKIPVALATSSIPSESDFVLGSLGIYNEFTAVVNISHIKNPKPHPEIYLNACNAIGVLPENCIGFEDSISGITALGKAGVKCIAVGSTLSYKKLKESGLKFNRYIKDFCDITVNDLIEGEL